MFSISAVETESLPSQHKMASSFDQSCDLKPSSFRRSQSRVYFESDNVTSPTSWEFRGIAGSPIPMRLSELRVSGSERSGSGSGGSCSKGEICADGSRNSTGSSTGSHRSQDSGFSDSGETRGQRRNGSQTKSSSHILTTPPQQKLSHDDSSQRRLVENVNEFDNKNSELVNSQTIDQRLTSNSQQNHHYQHSQLHQQQPYFPSPSSHQPDRVNHDCHTNDVHHHYTPHLQECQHSCHENGISECTNCLYQEIILAHSVHSSPLSPLPTDQIYQSTSVVELGAPTCASTPKTSSSKRLLPKYHSRSNVMDKIDNFESLNKNKKCLDNNNNNSFNKDTSSAKNFVNTSYDTVVKNNGHYNSSIVSTASVKRLSSPSSPSKSFYSTIKINENSNSNSNSHSVVVSGGHPCYESYSNNNESEDQRYYDDWNANSSTVNKTLIYTTSPSNRYSDSSSPKWQTLPKGFKRIPAPNNVSQEVIVKSHFDNDSLRLWIHELRTQAEPECLHTLQTKAVPLPESYQSVSYGHGRGGSRQDNFSHSPASPLNTTTLAIHSVSAPLFSIRNVEQMACVISREFSNICKHLEFGYFAQIPLLVESLSELLSEFLKHFHESFGNLQKLENRLAASCYELRHASRTLNLILSSSSLQLNGTSHLSDSKLSANQSMIAPQYERQFHAVIREIVDKIADLGHLFSQVVDQRLTRDLNSILNTIESGGIPARVGLRTYATVLNDGGMHICRLAASIRTVRGLLGVLLDSKDDNDKILALRCLATVLCVGEAVKDFDKAGGFEIIADILYDPIYESAIKYEAVAVLTQATDPWIDLETTLVNLGYHLEKIIVSLTNLIPQCKTNEDTFLLTIAAISNLTFLEISSLEILRRCRTIALILSVIREKTNFSIFILDHVATVLANMAGSERCRKSIVNSGGISALICFLHKRPLPLGSAAEITACERLQQKSTIAISRLCNEEGVAKLVMDMNGIERMIQLCRQEKERHYSDGVLIACLATLRKLVTFCGDKIVQGLHAQDLIQPRLLDSFLLYSSRQESYV